MDRNRARFTCGQTDRQVDRQKGRQIDRKTDRQIDRYKNNMYIIKSKTRDLTGNDVSAQPPINDCIFEHKRF